LFRLTPQGGWARHGRARQGLARQGVARQGMAGRGWAWQGKLIMGENKMELAVIKNNTQARWKPLYNAVIESKPDTMFTFAKLQSIIGIDIRKDRSIIYDCNRELLKEGKNILVNVYRQGYKISCNTQQIAHATGRKKKANNQLKLCKTELGGINEKSLSPDQRVNFMHFRNHVNLMLNVMESKAESNLEQSRIVEEQSRVAVKNQEASLVAIREMKAKLADLELSMSANN